MPSLSGTRVEERQDELFRLVTEALPKFEATLPDIIAALPPIFTGGAQGGGGAVGPGGGGGGGGFGAPGGPGGGVHTEVTVNQKRIYGMSAAVSAVVALIVGVLATVIGNHLRSA